MAAMIQKYGDQINGVWSDHGLEGSGALEALVEAGALHRLYSFDVAGGSLSRQPKWGRN